MQNQNSGADSNFGQKNLNISFIRDRVAPAEPVNDGKQTPMRGHPVFIAQHATATCCRGCIEKWHKFPQHRELTQTEQEYLVSVIMEWINRQINSNPVL